MKGRDHWYLVVAAVVGVLAPGATHAVVCPGGGATITADVVVFDTPIMFNRIGPQNPNWITYALRRDVVPIDPAQAITAVLPGGARNVQMRKDKRIRPLVLRVNEGDCLEVSFQNLLAPGANPFVDPNRVPVMNEDQAGADPSGLPFLAIDDQVAGRFAGFHVRGLHLVDPDEAGPLGGIASDASNVGRNATSLVSPGGSATYAYFAPAGTRGTYLADSYGATWGGEATAGNAGQGMFAAVNVEPKDALWYRSQVTEEEMRLAVDTASPASCAAPATPGYLCSGQPILNYEALYPDIAPWNLEGKDGLPVLNMRQANAIVHSDLNAIIAGPAVDGTFPTTTYPLESAGKRNPTVPNRLEPFREFTVVFHDEASVGQAFPGFFDANPVTQRILHGVRDTFMINYGVGGVGAEIIANRLGVGPMWDCLTCSYEEFFLASSAVGDPAMLVDVPANVGLEACLALTDPAVVADCPAEALGPKATRAFFPDDPSNVHHSYQNDRVVFRNLHAGKEHHIFHLHNHQWLFDANDDNANYLDAQAIGPSSGYTYEINFGGSGNRNKTSGDAIFHCHFYPHFAQGMWELWRIHDVFETGTRLAASNTATGFHDDAFELFDGTPAVHPDAGSTLPASARMRALPDGEILAGTPIPALVPLPGKAMALMPGEVVVVAKNANPGVDEIPDDPAACAADPTGPTCGVNELAESSQAFVVDRDTNPGYPFWIAGVECGTNPATCEQGVVGQRPPTPVLDMLSETQAAALRSEPGTLFDPLNNLGPTVGAAAFRNGGWDGGLPRHALDGFLAVGGRLPAVFEQEQTKFSFHKEIFKAKPVWYPEGGTDIERVAMAFHATRSYPSTALMIGAAPEGAAYITNGGLPQAGSPFFEPCVDDEGKTLFAGVTGDWFGATPGQLVELGTSPFNATAPRVYKGANVQIDAVFNKKGYHYPQQRIVSLWEDVLPYINKTKPPEVFVIRNNTLDCTRYLHTNLVPNRFEVDDYEVTTPTDIIGQHIHLPKWDLPSADGSGNGWNYEDGTLSPGSVRERIHAINTYNPSGDGNPPNSAGAGANDPLVAKPHPFFGAGALVPDPLNPGGMVGEYLGARTTIQRWMFDPLLNIHHVDRGLGIIFTHDHYGPSTVQQVGLYASVLTEPIGSRWTHNETGVPMYSRPDGGPTGWQAAILPGTNASVPAQFESFREFWFQHSDFQSAYEAGVYIGAGPDGRPNGVLPDADSFRASISPSVKELVAPAGFPDVAVHPVVCSADPTDIRPCPEAISADDPGFYVTNYRNEPVGWRVFDPDKIGPDGKPGMQADGLTGDLAFALQSRADRRVRPFGTRLGDTPYPPLTADIRNGDPFTPMMRAYAGDLIRVKSQAGGDEEEHNFSMNGVKWLQGGSAHGRAPNSGWRNAQHRGISEQFTFAAPVVPFVGAQPNLADYAYSHNTSQSGWWSGMWGILRAYNAARGDLFQLPTTRVPVRIGNPNDFNSVCPRTAPVRSYDVTAVLANRVLGNAGGVTIVPGDTSATQHVGADLDPAGGTLVYNPRDTALSNGRQGPLHDPTSILYVRTADLEVPNPAAPGCFRTVFNPDGTTTLVFDSNLPSCPLRLREGAPVEPLVLRANAGECVEVRLRNHLPGDENGNGFFDDNPDLAGFHDLIFAVPRDKGTPGTLEPLTWFGNNLIRPSSFVGLHPQLVAIDVTRDDGMVVGQNPPGNEVVAPGQNKTYRWYAGDVTPVRSGSRFNLVATPVEFGGANLMPADPVKQGQKGLVGALAIGPQGAVITETDTTWDHQQTDQTVPRETRTSATLNGTIRDFAAVFQKGLNFRYADGTAVEVMGGEVESGDSGQMAINYGTEPMWFRFGLRPDAPFGNTPGGFGAVPNPEQAYSNSLAVDPGGPVAVGDPATPVFTAAAGAPVRMHVLLPSGVERGSVFHLHGHLWQRAPYICPGQTDGTGLAGKCDWTDFGAADFEIGSRVIGVNPIGMYLGAQESVLPAAHFDVVLPGAGTAHGGAGGVNQVAGDYLFRDQGSFGNTMGLWGILRVE